MAYKRSLFPQEPDVFVEKLDLPASKLPLVEEYHTLYIKEVKTDKEQARLNVLMKELESHLYTPEHINHFQDAMTNVQKFFVDNTSAYVQRLQDNTTVHMDMVKTDANAHADIKKAEIEKKRDEVVSHADTIKVDTAEYMEAKKQQVELEMLKLQHKGTYNPTTNYFSKNIVDYTASNMTQLYMCVKDNTVAIEPTNTNHWLKLTIQGVRGERGAEAVGLKFGGAYDQLKTYKKDDGVQYGGLLFASFKDGNKGNLPNPARDTQWWGKALDVSVTVTKQISTITVDYDTDEVSFLGGELKAFNKDVDILEVYQNSTRLTNGVDYILSEENTSIIKLDDVWLGTSKPIFFEFVATKNMVNELVFSDGSAIADGTVAKSKLSPSVQRSLEDTVSSSLEQPDPVVTKLWLDGNI